MTKPTDKDILEDLNEEYKKMTLKEILREQSQLEQEYNHTNEKPSTFMKKATRLLDVEIARKRRMKK